ncbi:MAG: hypothetical protein RL117_1663 [Verrucomicrobiota bacterium]|jgi:hypothetical protein
MAVIVYGMMSMSNSQRAGSWYLTVIGLALCFIASIFLWLMMRSYMRAREMTTWPQVACLILSSEVEENRIAENVAPDFRLAVLYRYQFQGKDYESPLWSLRGSMPRTEKSAVEKLVKQFPQGSQQTCWVNPRQPEIAVLTIDSRAAGYSLWFPGLFFLGGVGMIWGAWRRPRG